MVVVVSGGVVTLPAVLEDWNAAMAPQVRRAPADAAKA
ncbi:hypothetical protein SAMN05421869_13151 [Nonomuraea jiangxiensis]|uniref:Uncharacterized protein n=1 Tax=Nonomuraea jiangxiensis TaxID=633440 RepID=A0A1G9N686_9ACTN|nr:hypothetical protein SAMN05421869_13151 [Nonomuraea jiangxiensis]